MKNNPTPAKNTLVCVRFQFFYPCIEMYVQQAKIKRFSKTTEKIIILRYFWKSQESGYMYSNLTLVVAF